MHPLETRRQNERAKRALPSPPGRNAALINQDGELEAATLSARQTKENAYAAREKTTSFYKRVEAYWLRFLLDLIG
ncbi:MAG TPA: hypothetical protein VJX68_01435, partial [Candidatus Binatus sp.]|uniref:hypothetical protein n=1 Tax=Candidatus Binatus sp. TaxID=2811406 RepID=UPI002B4A1C19